MSQLTKTIRALIATAHHSKCESFGKCPNCKCRCASFIPSKKLYEVVRTEALKAIKPQE